MNKELSVSVPRSLHADSSERCKDLETLKLLNVLLPIMHIKEMFKENCLRVSFARRQQLAKRWVLLTAEVSGALGTWLSSCEADGLDGHNVAT